jgi:hypothetical protein
MDHGGLFNNAASDESPAIILADFHGCDHYISKQNDEYAHFEMTPPEISSAEESYLPDQPKQHQMNG